MKKGFFARAGALMLALALSISLIGCSVDTGYTIEGGDTNNITINQSGEDKTAAASKAMLSAVSVISVFGASALQGSAQSNGSGVIYRISEGRTEAYIVTNYHVIYSAGYGISRNIYLFLYGMEASEYAINAEFVGGSMNYDLAVLKVTGSELLMRSEAVAADFADSDEVRILDEVIAIGNARGNGLSATVGHINVESEYIPLLAADERSSITLRVMRTDAAVNHGNSGGGLFNTRGEVVGIVNAKSTDDAVDNMGYAIPSNVAKNIVDNILYYCDGTSKTSVYRCLLGITVESKNLRTSYNMEKGVVDVLEDITVSKINTGSVAASYFKVGDVIKTIQIGESIEQVNRRHTLIDFMLMARPGTAIKFEVLRDGAITAFEIIATEEMLEEYI